MSMRLRRAAWWTMPFLFSVWLYWVCFQTWFLQDDFAWLGLHLSIQSPRDFWSAMFAPMAQGTIRPWSERGFFLLFEWLFGWNALPFRIWVFTTLFADLLLIASVTRTLTGSAVAGFLAPVLWVMNSALSGPLSWASGYNQILCAFFLLAAFRLWLSYVETGKARYYASQWAVFLLGFGALELNVVYPALAVLHTLLRARKYLPQAAAMIPASAVYAAVHRMLAGGETAGVYRMYWDAGIFSTFWTYVEYALGPARLAMFGRVDPAWLLAGTLVLLALILLAAARQAPLSLFFLGWFVIVLAPLLPLRDHISDYYLTIPSIGLAMLGAWAISSARAGCLFVRAAALLAAGLYVASHVPVTRFNVRWTYDRSVEMRSLFASVAKAHARHPGAVILLDNLPSELFWSGIPDEPFRLFGARVYLTPSQTAIRRRPEADVDAFVLPEIDTKYLVEHELAQVYDVSRFPIRNITRAYYHDRTRNWPSLPPSRVAAGLPSFDPLFGKGWYSAEEGFRWMAGSASVTLGNPHAGKPQSATLRLTGTVPEPMVGASPTSVTVTVEGRPAAVRQFTQAGSLDWSIPLKGPVDNVVDITIECGRTFTVPADGRQLCLAISNLTIQ